MKPEGNKPTASTDVSSAPKKDDETESTVTYTFLAPDSNLPPSERPGYVVPAGAAAGAYATYKGVGSDLLKPQSGLFAPRPIPGSAAIPNAASVMSDIEHTMQSGQGKREGVTGRQRELTHNMETNRQAMANEQNLAKKGAKQLIVNAGPMYANEAGIMIPKSAAVQLEQEKMMADAKAKVAAQKAAEEAAEKAATKAKLSGKLMGAGKVGLGALGGGLSAKQLYDAATSMYNNGPSARSAADALGGAGGLAMMYPTPLTVGAGLAAQLPSLGYAAYDYFNPPEKP